MSPDEIKITQIQTLKDFENIQSEWNGLIAGCGSTTVFLTQEWLGAWWKIHQRGRELWLITAWTGNTLVGAMPLMKSTVRRMGLQFRILQSLGTPNIDESTALALQDDQNILKALYDHLHTRQTEWDILEVNEFLSESTALKSLRQYFEELGYSIRGKTNQHFFIPLTNSWEAYWKKLSKNLRHNIERRLRRIEENHKIRFEVIEGKDLTWDTIEILFRIHDTGNYSNKYTSPDERELQQELMNRLRATNRVRVMILWFDDQPVAFDYGFTRNGIYEDWRTAFDLAFSEWGPGTLMLYYQLQYLCHQNHQTLDFLRGEYNYKDKWMPSKREFSDLRIIPKLKFSARLAFVWIPDTWLWIKSRRKSLDNNG